MYMYTYVYVHIYIYVYMDCSRGLGPSLLQHVAVLKCVVQRVVVLFPLASSPCKKHVVVLKHVNKRCTFVS